jgi:hypothetical protein
LLQIEEEERMLEATSKHLSEDDFKVQTIGIPASQEGSTDDYDRKGCEGDWGGGGEGHKVHAVTSFSNTQLERQKSTLIEKSFDHGRLGNDKELTYIKNDADIFPVQKVMNIGNINRASDDGTDFANATTINGGKINYVPRIDVDIVVGAVNEEDDDEEDQGSDEESSEEEDEEPITPLHKLYDINNVKFKSLSALPPCVSSSSPHTSPDNDDNEDQKNVYKNPDKNGNEIDEAKTGIVLDITTSSIVILEPDMPINMNSENTNKAGKSSLTAKRTIVRGDNKDHVNDKNRINIADKDTNERKIVNRPGTNGANTIRPLKFRLADFYPHIGMIFPIAYGFAGNVQAEGFSARALIESMQFQGKLYQEWMEVMGDYATVFSQNRGLPTDDGIDAAALTSSSSVYSGGIRALHYRVKASIRPEVYNIVTDVFNSSLPMWNELPSGDNNDV